MAVSFSARRKPKKVASSEPRDDESQQQNAENEDGPVVRRPNAGPKQKSKLRISFDPGAESTADDSSDAAQPAQPKPSRIGASLLSRSGPAIAERRDETSRPTYSRSHLDELKTSTPSTPKDISLYTSSAEEDLPAQTQSLDIASKFGASAVTKSAIPSAAEIAEKKERRLRLAKEHDAQSLTNTSIKNNDDFVSLDAYDSDGEFKPSRLQLSTFRAQDNLLSAQEHSRLVPEDEDIAEGFDSFVEDDTPATTSARSKGRILMGMQSSADQERARMRAMIDAAEGGSDATDDASDSDSTGSDASAEHAYVSAQTAHGTAFSNLTKKQRREAEKAQRRPRQPAKIPPVPTLATSLGRLRELKEVADANKQRAEMRQDEIRRRLVEIEGEKTRIQGALEEVGRMLDEVDGQVRDQKNGDAAPHGGGGGLDDIAERVG